MPIHDHTPSSLGRGFLWGGIALGLLLIVVLYTHAFGLLLPAPPPAPPPPLTHQGDRILVPEGSPLRARITVMPVSMSSTNQTLRAPAMVEVDPARTAAVMPSLGGRVVQLRVGLGDRVKAGQILAVIDSPDLGQAFADNDKAADTFGLTLKTLQRQEEQSRLGAASTRDVDQARSDHVQAQAEYTRTRARLKALGVNADGTQHERLLSVTSPLNGSVTSLQIAVGSRINDPTQPLMSVADLSTVWVTALIAERDIGSIDTQQQAEVRIVAYPQRSLRGKVLFISDVIDSDSRRAKLRIAFANSDYSLKPNMYATVTLLGRPQSNVVLPTSALLMNNDRTTVFVATAPWTFERRAVDAQLQEGSSVIVNSGLQAGDQVVVRGGILLND